MPWSHPNILLKHVNVEHANIPMLYSNSRVITAFAVRLCLIASMLALSTFASDDTTVATIGWKDDPNGRGTASLVMSCLFTLGLCVWTAMHLNIPPVTESSAQSWLRNLTWGLIGVFAPELVVFAAWRQYNSAKELCAEVKVPTNTGAEPSATDRRQSQSSNAVLTKSTDTICSWTLVHGFYAGMGGFVIDLGTPRPYSNKTASPESNILTLTPRGIVLLAKCGLLPKLKKGDIIDKSKADSYAKSLTCLQASWMILQVISRLVHDLPVTLLEVNVLGHILCALVIYILWWHKPRLVREPTRLTGEWTRAVGAYMYMSSQISGRENKHAGLLRRTWTVSELSALALVTDQLRGEMSLQDVNYSNVGFAWENQASPTMDFATWVSAFNTLELWPSHFRPRNRPHWERLFEGPEVPENIESSMDLFRNKRTRWELAEEAIRTHPEIRQRFVTQENTAEGSNHRSWSKPVTEELVTNFAPNWPGEDLLRGTGSLVMGMVLWFASIAYGGVHIAAWNDYYPSPVEAWMWRLSAIYASFSGLVWLIINLLAFHFRVIDKYWDEVLAFQARRRSYIILGTICSLCGFAYVFARMFLVIEAWISIRRLPLAAYKTVDWTQLFPHV